VRHRTPVRQPSRLGTVQLLAAVGCVAALTYVAVDRLAGASTMAQRSPVTPLSTAPANIVTRAAPEPVASAASAATGGLPRSAIVGVMPSANLGGQAAVSPPVRVRIPAIGVDSSLQSLGLLPDGTLQPPSQWQQAGWFADGVRPGALGPAVIAGHVDSVSGPAVFYRLRELRPGDEVDVAQRTGRWLRFVVQTVRAYPKAQFPTEAVYGPTASPELRVITCTGDFDRAKHSYVDNLVVSARLAIAGR
jgi:hypothetical protein